MKGKKSAKSDGARSAVWRNRIVGHGEVNPLEIVAHPKNYKAHPDHQAGALRAAIEDVGFVRSVTVNKRTGTLIDGHLRVGMAIKEKQSKIAVEYVDLSEAEEKRVLATLDPIGSMAEIDEKALSELLDGIGDVARQLRAPPPPAKKKRRPAANTQATIGAYRFEIPRGKYEKWVEQIREKVGFEEESIVDEIRRRLGLR